MSSYDILQNNFPSGEISPLWKGKSNSDFYRTGLDTCKNFMPMTPSGLRRRPGTQFLRQTYNNTDALIIPISVGYGEDNSLVCEVTYGHARVWYVGSPDTIKGEVSSSLLNFSDLSSVHYAVNKKAIWFVSLTMKPVRIDISGSYSSGYTLTVSQPTFTGGMTFSSSGDYPNCIAFKGGRLLLGGTSNQPNAIFASRSPDYSSSTPDRYTDFTFGTESDYALEVEDNELVQPRWFLNSYRFLVGSERIIFSDDGAAITPSGFDISPTLREGSAWISAKGLKNYVVYVGTSGKTMGILIYDSDSAQYVSRPLTTNSSHLFAPGVNDFAITFMPDPVLWVLLNDNTILSCTVDLSSGSLLTGWARHTVPGGRTISRLISVTGTDGKDILYMVVKVNSSYHIETLTIDDIFSNTESKIYLDMAITRQVTTATNTFTYTSLMAGKTVSVIGDGAILPDAVVANDGTITLDTKVKTCVIGLPYESLVGFLSQEQPTNGQSSFGNKRRLKKVTLRVYQSFGGYVGLDTDTDKMQELFSTVYGSQLYGQVPELVDKDFVSDVQSTNITSITLYVKTDFPTPLNILALKEKVELLET